MQRPELQEVEQLAHRAGVDFSEGQIVEPGGEGHVAHQPHHFGVGADLLLGLGQVLAQPGRELLQGGEDPVEPSPFVDELRGGLLPHSGHSREVVAGVAPERRVGDIVRGPYTGALGDAGLVVQLVVRHPPHVVEHPQVGVLHQLVGVAVAGHDDHVVAAVAACGGQGGDHVVGLEAGCVDHRYAQRVEHLAHQAHLLAQDVGRSVAGGLVGGNPAVPEGRLGTVKSDDDLVGIVVAPKVDEHRSEAEHRVGDLPRSGGHVGGQREEGAVGQRVAVDQHHRGHSPNLR